MLTEAAQASVDAAQADRLARMTGAKPLIDSRFGARTLGDFALVEPGAEVWARGALDGLLRQGDDNEPGMEGVQARGGIVLEIIDAPEVTDDGEIVQVRAFRTFDYDPRLKLHEAFTTLTEAQVDPTRFTPMEVSRVRRTYRRLCRHIGEQKGVASGFEIDLVTAAARLAAIVGQTVPR